MRRLSHVPAILKLPKILRKMLLADMDMCAIDPALNRRPKAFNGVDARASWRDILLSRMIYCFVIIAVRLNRLVSGMLISVDDRVGAHSILDNRQQRITTAVADGFQLQRCRRAPTCQGRTSCSTLRPCSLQSCCR